MANTLTESGGTERAGVGGGFWARLLLAPLPDDYPNRLATAPDRTPLKPAGVTLFWLTILCLLPRAWMSTRIPAICPDGIFYIKFARIIEQHGILAGIREHGLNTFPLILAALHRLGLDWETAGRLWGIVISSLAVLPLYGWVRRQFCDRVALIAGLLYAFHPTLLRWSPEIVRESTFWFLLCISVYLLWRSLVEVRPWMYVLALGVTLLAAMTRCEGLFLAPLVIVWTWARARAVGGKKFPIRWAILSAALVLGAIALAAGVAVFRRGQTPIYTMTPLKLAWAWISARFDAHWLASPVHEEMQYLAPGESVGRILAVLVPTLYRAYTPLYGLLTLLGIGLWRRVYARSDNLAPLLSAIGLFTGMWIAMWCVHESSPRYALTAVILGMAWPSLALLSISQWLSRMAERFSVAAALRGLVIYSPLAATVVAGLVSVMLVDSAKQGAEMRVGRWIRQQSHPPAVIVGPTGATTIVAYYAGVTDSRIFPWNSDDQFVLAMVRDNHPDMVLLRLSKKFTVERCESLLTQIQPLGFAVVPDRRRPEDCRDIYLLERATPADQQAGRGRSTATPSLKR